MRWALLFLIGCGGQVAAEPLCIDNGAKQCCEACSSQCCVDLGLRPIADACGCEVGQ